MTNIIDRLEDYFTRKNESWCVWYIRCLNGLIFLYAIIGFLAGALAGFIWVTI